MNQHPLAGKTVRLKKVLDDAEFVIEDWWIRVSGQSWMDPIDPVNPAALQYALRVDLARLPFDDQVVYGKVGGFGVLVHESEIGEIVED